MSYLRQPGDDHLSGPAIAQDHLAPDLQQGPWEAEQAGMQGEFEVVFDSLLLAYKACSRGTAHMEPEGGSVRRDRVFQAPSVQCS